MTRNLYKEARTISCKKNRLSMHGITARSPTLGEKKALLAKTSKTCKLQNFFSGSPIDHFKFKFITIKKLREFLSYGSYLIFSFEVEDAITWRVCGEGWRKIISFGKVGKFQNS